MKARRGTVHRLVMAAAALLLAAGCTRLVSFNAVVPKDGDARLMVRGARFGEGPRQRVDVYAPSRYMVPSHSHRWPVIVFLYGGSWQSGTRLGYGFVGRALASRGFVVAIPDYRLYPEVRYPAFLEDNAAAVRWVRAHAADFGGDPDRIVLLGHSAGAYDAAMLALDPEWLGSDRAAIRGFAGLAGPYDFLPLDDPAAKAVFGGWPRPEETQPIRYASAEDPPALIAAGEDDDRVRPANSTALAAALGGAGVAVEERRYRHIGHAGILTALARPLRGRAPVLSDVTTFAARVTR